MEGCGVMSDNTMGPIGLGVWIDPFAMVDIMEAELRITPNEHAIAHIRGTIDEELESEYLSLAQTDLEVTISQTDENGMPTIMYVGIVDNMEITNLNGQTVMDLWLVSSTRLMDLVKHTRTYQDASMVYNDLLATLGDYPGYYYSMRVGDGAALGELITQFEETDWEFIIRLASHFGGVAVPAYVTKGTGYFFGIPEKTSRIIVNPIHYRIIKGLGEHVDKTRNQVDGIFESDSMYYEIRDRAIYRLGENVRFKNRDLRVFAIHSVLEGQLLQNYYSLKSEKGFKTKKAFNFDLVGASLGCTVTGVQKDMVKVSIHEAQDDYGSNTRWFPFSTVYSSPDGSGWYAMPEKGDVLRLYFPSELESQAYTISAVNVDTPMMGTSRQPAPVGHPATPQPRTNPDVKTLINKELKEVSLYPDKIIVTNNKGMTIVVDDAEGITIISDKKITFKSDEAIDIASANSEVNVFGADKVTLKVGGTKVELTKNIKFEGGSLYMQ